MLPLTPAQLAKPTKGRRPQAEGDDALLVESQRNHASHNIFTSIPMRGWSEPWRGPIRSLHRRSIRCPWKVDLCMHRRATDGDDNEGRARVREVRSISYCAQWFSAGAGIKRPVACDQFNGLKATMRSFYLLSATVAHLDKIGGIWSNEECISHEHRCPILTWGKFQPILWCSCLLGATWWAV